MVFRPSPDNDNSTRKARKRERNGEGERRRGVWGSQSKRALDSERVEGKSYPTNKTLSLEFHCSQQRITGSKKKKEGENSKKGREGEKKAGNYRRSII
ncbi:hypothetical protein CEXT_594331 [Caerostris extrusa]|uniref:Uncharacterized protein n=1 Tax=Caerostris extrusa TaxID=172846 RepID=A0AAV4UX03_CAEEX|nr:hypothetical protein CEXT_594331 [Caerostris extrusa]